MAEPAQFLSDSLTPRLAGQPIGRMETVMRSSGMRFAFNPFFVTLAGAPAGIPALAIARMTAERDQ